MAPDDEQADVHHDQHRICVLEREVAELRDGMETRGLIGQAIGMFRERYRIGEDSAFGLLVRLSQNSNVKVRVLAERMTADVNGRGAFPEQKRERR